MLKHEFQRAGGSLLKRIRALSNACSQLQARRVALPVVAAIAGLSASPAAANPLTDCFAVAVRHIPHHHKSTVHHLVHRVRPRTHVHKVADASPTPTYAYRMRYILRPRACDSHPVVAMSPLPGVAPPGTSQQLIAELAGPTAPRQEVEGAAPPTVEPGVVDTPTPGPDFPGGPPTGGPPIVPGPPGIGGPGTPGGPGNPPVAPPGPPVVPPDTPPVVPPLGPPAPLVIDQPPPGPPGTPPTDVPPGVIRPEFTPPIVPAAIPEPASWAMLLLGFFGLGVGLRLRRSRAAKSADAIAPGK